MGCVFLVFGLAHGFGISYFFPFQDFLVWPMDLELVAFGGVVFRFSGLFLVVQ